MRAIRFGTDSVPTPEGFSGEFHDALCYFKLGRKLGLLIMHLTKKNYEAIQIRRPAFDEPPAKPPY